MGGRLEHEIRRIAHVVACSIVDGEIVVLIAPDAYQPTLERAVRKVVSAAGSSANVRVIGGIEPIPHVLDPIATRRRAVLVGSAAGMAALAATSLFAGLSVAPSDIERALRPTPAVETDGSDGVPARGQQPPHDAAPTQPIASIADPFVDLLGPALIRTTVPTAPAGSAPTFAANPETDAPTVSTGRTKGSTKRPTKERRVRRARSDAPTGVTTYGSGRSCWSFAEARARSKGRAPRSRTMQGRHGGRAWTCWFAAHWRSR